jgi:hypothetical protein
MRTSSVVVAPAATIIACVLRGASSPLFRSQPADMQWAIIGWMGMAAVVLMAGYVVYVHLWRTIPSITRDKRAQLLMQYAAEQRAAEKLGAHADKAAAGGGEKTEEQCDEAAAPAGAMEAK